MYFLKITHRNKFNSYITTVLIENKGQKSGEQILEKIFFGCLYEYNLNHI